MLLVLGMQLSRVRLDRHLALISLGAVMKLVAAPLVALVFASLLRLAGVAWQVALVQSAMPTAVTTVIISEEFEASPVTTSGMVLVTTVLSIASLTALLALIT